ncbi:MAG: MATE family efflux transporter [Eubacteriales bacterium]|nr:MATE family efflux transporter [Eubacteriales bacterium]
MTSLAGKIENRTSLRELAGMIAVIAVPVALQNLLTTTASMLDTIMIAPFGEASVGALGLCAQFSTLMFSGYWGFMGGVMLFISQFFGAGDDENIERSYGMTMVFMMISGFVFGGLALFAPEKVMSLYTGNAEIRRIGAEYLRIAGYAYPLQVFAMVQSCLLRSIERVRIPLAGGAVGFVTNFTVNFILIYGRLGLPKMGVRGAAVGTVCAAVLNVAVVFALVKITNTPYMLCFRSHFRWKTALLKHYLRKSAPIIANEVLYGGVGNMLINIVLGHQSVAAVAATAVFRVIEGIIIAFFSGFSSAATVLVGQEIGAGNHEDGWSRAYRNIYLCQGLTAIVCVVLLLIRRPLFTAMGLSGESLAIASGMIMIFSVAGVLRMGNWCMNDTFRVGGDPAFGSVLEISFMFLMVQPAIHLADGPLGWPFLAVFALCYCDEPVRYVIMQLHMYSGKWIRPVSASGLETIGAFREKYGIILKNQKIQETTAGQNNEK